MDLQVEFLIPINSLLSHQSSEFNTAKTHWIGKNKH